MVVRCVVRVPLVVVTVVVVAIVVLVRELALGVEVDGVVVQVVPPGDRLEAVLHVVAVAAVDHDGLDVEQVLVLAVRPDPDGDDTHDLGDRQDLLPDVVRVDVDGHALHEDASGVPNQRDTRLDHQPCDDERHDRVRTVEAGEQDDGRRDRRADEREQVVEHVLERTLHGHALAVRLADGPGREHVHDDTDQRGHQHVRTVDIRHLEQVVDRVARHQCAETHQRHTADQGRQDADALEPEGHAVVGRPVRQVDGGDRHHELEHVGEHVSGVADQGLRVGDEAYEDLAEHVQPECGRRDLEPALVSVGRDGVRVSRMPVVIMSVPVGVSLGAGGSGVMVLFVSRHDPSLSLVIYNH